MSSDSAVLATVERINPGAGPKADAGVGAEADSCTNAAGQANLLTPPTNRGA